MRGQVWAFEVGGLSSIKFRSCGCCARHTIVPVTLLCPHTIVPSHYCAQLPITLFCPHAIFYQLQIVLVILLLASSIATLSLPIKYLPAQITSCMLYNVKII